MIKTDIVFKIHCFTNHPVFSSMWFIHSAENEIEAKKQVIENLNNSLYPEYKVLNSAAIELNTNLGHTL